MDYLFLLIHNYYLNYYMILFYTYLLLLTYFIHLFLDRFQFILCSASSYESEMMQKFVSITNK